MCLLLVEVTKFGEADTPETRNPDDRRLVSRTELVYFLGPFFF